MADRSSICSCVRVQSQSHDLAAVHVWVALKAACGHSRRFFGDGPASLPTEPTTPVCPVLAGSVGVFHA